MPDDTKVSLDVVYPELERYGRGFLTRLEELVPDFICHIDSDSEKNKRLNNLILLQEILSGFNGLYTDSVFDLYFCLNTYVTELCGWEWQEKKLNQLDWNKIFSSYNFYLFLEQPVNAIFFQELLTKRRNSRLISMITDIPFSERYKLFQKSEKHSSIKPFFNSTILFALESLQECFLTLTLENYWIFDLPTKVRDYILLLAKPDSQKKEIPQEFLLSDKKYNNYILPYITEDRSFILEQLYKGQEIKEVLADIYNFIFTNDQEGWFRGLSDEETLLIPQFDDRFDGDGYYIENVFDTLLKYLLKRMTNSGEIILEDILSEALQNDYTLWEQINYLFEEDEYRNSPYARLVGALADTAYNIGFIDKIKTNLKFIKIDFSLSYNPPAIFNAFLDILLNLFSEKYEPSRNFSFLFFFNSLYSGPIIGASKKDWYVTKKKECFSKIILSVLSSENEKQIQDFFNFQNIKIEDFENCDNYIWYEWVIEAATELIRINPDYMDTENFRILTKYLPGLENHSLKLITNPTFIEIFNPIIEKLYQTLIDDPDKGYGSLNSPISIVLMQSHYPQYLEYIRQNCNKILNRNEWIPILVFNQNFFPKDFILEKLLQHQFFESFSVANASIFDLSEVEIKDYVLQQIISNNFLSDEITKLYHNIRNILYVWVEEQSEPGYYKHPDSFSQTGLEIFTKLLNILEEHSQSKNHYIVLIWDILMPLKDYSFISEDQISQLKRVAGNQLIQLRKVVRGIDSTPVEPNFIEACNASGYILERIDDKSKLLNNLLTTFKYIQETTLGSDLDAYGSERYSAYQKITRLIHSILDRKHVEDGLSLRKELTEFLVKKLKPLKKVNPDRLSNPIPDHIGSTWDGWAPEYTEPDPVWRYAYVHAIRNLGIHSRGKNHFYAPLLSKIAKHDPSEKVRKAAYDAAQELNNLKKGYASGSHKRHLLNAWWWIRQAHVITTGGIIDPEGAQKTRIKEIRN